MLQKIRVRNFKSLQEVSLELRDVNLLIGANNSGKSNFLKALVFFSEWMANKAIKKEDFDRLVFGQKEIIISPDKNESVGFQFIKREDEKTYHYELELYGRDNHEEKYIENQFLGLSIGKQENDEVNIHDLDTLYKQFYGFKLKSDALSTLHPHSDLLIGESASNISLYKHNPAAQLAQGSSHLKNGTFLKESLDDFDGFPEQLIDTFENLKIYQPNPSQFSKPYPTLAQDYTLKEDASNLVSFLDNMRDEFPEVNQAIIEDLQKCVNEFTDLRFKKVDFPENSEERKIYGNQTFKKFGLFDKYGNTYWADELSEGTLYFLALLAIIHQPNPPRLLLLEEPEKGIHPRRIKEVLDFIFDVSSAKNIQVIMTSHNLDVLNAFEDMPENVFVFDKNDSNSTEIKNLYDDIITPKEKEAEEKGYELDLSNNLGMRWKTGFFGGVPMNNL